jgi:hypothetical protein
MSDTPAAGPAAAGGFGLPGVAAARSRPRAGPSRAAVAMVVAAMVAIVVAMTVATGASPIRAGKLPDTDDYMRLVQVFDWLDGAGFRDLLQHRLDPPAGTPMHWSRLVDLPLAAVIGAAEPWLGRPRAALLAAAIVPPLLLVLFLLAVAWMARPLTGRGGALPVAMLAALPIPLAFQFEPGRVDHDNWQLILAALLVGASGRLALRPAATRPALVAAAAGAAGLWIGGEMLPWLAAFHAALALIWIRGRPIARSGLIAAAACLGCTVLLWLLVVAPARRWTVECDGFGMAYAALPAATLYFWAGLWVLERRLRAWPVRLVAAGVAGIVALLAFADIFPACSRGPLGQMDPRLFAIFAAHIAEAQPLAAMFGGSLWKVPLAMIGPVLALAVTILHAARGRGRARSAWLAAAVFIGLALAITLGLVRVLPFALLFSTAPLVRLAQKVAVRCRGRLRMIAKPVLLGLAGPLLLLVPPIWIAATAADPAASAGTCDVAAAAPVLADPAGLGARRRVILAPIHDGAELLFRTPHAVIAGPYHRDVSGNLDAFDFFTATSAAAAEAIVRRRGVELVFLCPGHVDMWLPPEEPGTTAFITALGGTGPVPPWLRRIPLPPASGAVLFEVLPP